MWLPPPVTVRAGGCVVCLQADRKEERRGGSSETAGVSPGCIVARYTAVLWTGYRQQYHVGGKAFACNVLRQQVDVYQRPPNLPHFSHVPPPLPRSNQLTLQSEGHVRHVSPAHMSHMPSPQVAFMVGQGLGAPGDGGGGDLRVVGGVRKKMEGLGGLEDEEGGGGEDDLGGGGEVVWMMPGALGGGGRGGLLAAGDGGGRGEEVLAGGGGSDGFRDVGGRGGDLRGGGGRGGDLGDGGARGGGESGGGGERGGGGGGEAVRDRGGAGDEEPAHSLTEAR